MFTCPLSPGPWTWWKLWLMLELLILNVILNHKGNGNIDVSDKDRWQKYCWQIVLFFDRSDDFTIRHLIFIYISVTSNSILSPMSRDSHQHHCCQVKPRIQILKYSKRNFIFQFLFSEWRMWQVSIPFRLYFLNVIKLNLWNLDIKSISCSWGQYVEIVAWKLTEFQISA